MKRIYEVQVEFDHPKYRGERRSENYWVEASSIVSAVALGLKVARKEYMSPGAYAPRVERVEERGTVDAR